MPRRKQPTTVLLLVLLSPCGAWRSMPRGTTLPRALVALDAPSRVAFAPVAAAGSGAAAGHLGGQPHNPQNRQLRNKLRATISDALGPLRRLLALAWRLVERALLSLRKLFAAARSESRLAVVPFDVVALDSARSLGNLLLVGGAAMRTVPPVDEVLAFFRYSSSPFYAELPAEAATAGSSSSVPAAATTSVCWLQHRYARPRSDVQRACDEGRLLLLRELYDEALAQERLQRGAAARFTFPWDDS